MNKRGLPQSVRMKHDLHYVEELFQDQSGFVGRYIPIEQIKPNPDQPRQAIGDLTELIASIREKGVLEPLLVRRNGEEFQIIAGERRWRACQELGISMLPCIEKDVDDREMLEIALIENLQRKDLTPFEESEGLRSLAEKFHYTHAQIAQALGKSRTSITESLSLNHMPDEIRTLCRDADISTKSLLLEIARQPDLQSMQMLIERIRKENLTRQAIRETKQHEAAELRPQPFVYRLQGKGFKLIITFNKVEVTTEDIKDALNDAFDSLNRLK